MNLVVQAPWHLVVDLPAKTGQAAEGRLDVAARAAESVIEVEVPERGIEVVTPHQAHHAAAEPDAFRIPARSIDGLRRLDEFVGLALVVLGRVGRIGSCGFLILGRGGAALGDGASDADQDGKSGNGEVAKNRGLKLKHPPTHTYPDLFIPLAAVSGADV